MNLLTTSCSAAPIPIVIAKNGVLAFNRRQRMQKNMTPTACVELKKGGKNGKTS